MSTTLSLYNPRDVEPEQLMNLLTGRTALLEEILDNLREQAGGKTRQHWLLRGQRGMGKTHLTGVIHYRVGLDPQLQKAYLPLWLGEADVYEVYSAATLLVKIAERLVEATRDEGLRQQIQDMEGVGDEESFFEAMLDLLSEEAKRQERTLLVLMENLDALLERFAPKDRKVQTRQLRSVLLHNPRFLFISTTPTRYLRALSDPKEPLYGHLKERDLAPLTEPEVHELFGKLVELTGRKELKVALEGEDGPLRLRIIHQLTGGLPRSVIMAFTVMQREAGLEPLVEGLRKFLDAQTAYFEARLARLAPREGSIVTTMALARENLTLKEIAQKSRLPERTLSTLMQRLEDDGHVRLVPGSGAGGKGGLYELSEGLFRLWYQYRRGQVVLEPLVEFIAVWFRAEDIQTLVEQHRRRVDEVIPTQRHSARLALLQVEVALQRASSEEGRRHREAIWESARRAFEFSGASDSEQREAFVRQAMAIFEKGAPEQCMSHFLRFWEEQGGAREQLLWEGIAYVTVAAARRAEEGGDGERELKICQLALERFDQALQPPELEPALALIRSVELGTLLVLGRYEEVLARVDVFLKRFERLGPPSALPDVVIFAEVSALWRLGRQGASLQRLKELLLRPRLDEEFERELASQLWSRFLNKLDLSSLEQGPERDMRCEVMKLYVDRFQDLQGMPVTFYVAGTAVRLVDSHGWGQRRLEAAAGWLSRYGSENDPHILTLQALMRRMNVWGYLSIRNFNAAKSDAEYFVDSAVGGKLIDRMDIVESVLMDLPVYLAAFGPTQVIIWLKRLNQPWLNAESRQQIELHQQVAKVLLAEREASEVGRKTRQERSELLRVPPELRKTLESTVRQVRKMKKELGAEW
jgi:hypothetical protein